MRANCRVKFGTGYQSLEVIILLFCNLGRPSSTMKTQIQDLFHVWVTLNANVSILIFVFFNNKMQKGILSANGFIVYGVVVLCWRPIEQYHQSPFCVWGTQFKRSKDLYLDFFKKSMVTEHTQHLTGSPWSSPQYPPRPPPPPAGSRSILGAPRPLSGVHPAA
jgi:hypothetical protein